VSTVLIDVRPRAAYEAGHVPGAVHLDPETDLSTIGPDPAEGGRHPLPSDGQLEDVFARAGVGPSSFVLALDDGSGWAARCWWLLRHVGHDTAGTLDLGSYLGPLSTDEVESPRGEFRARPRSGDTIAAEEILARLDDPALALYDARSRSRWLGDGSGSTRSPAGFPGRSTRSSRSRYRPGPPIPPKSSPTAVQV